MRLLLLLFATASVVLSRVSTADGASGTAMMNMATITELDVVCDKSGMTVTIDFSQPFNGIIFSKGHYSNPACRYVEENSGQSTYTIRISGNECGSLMQQIQGEISRTQLSNVIIVQNDKYIQEIWDVARKLSCDWIDNYVKTVNFNPFTVGMLQAQEVRFQGDQPIECWMDLQKGKYPDISDINSIVKIGEPLSLLLYARDNDYLYDVSVKDCYAFAGPNYDDPNTPRIQLTDVDGCVLKDKLIKPFQTVREDDRQGSVIVTYAYVHAFKFPDVMDVYMTCNVEICKGDCDKKCSISNEITTTTTTEKPRRYGSTLFGEPIYTTKPTPFCPPGSNDPQCPTEKPKCYPGSTDPSCYPKTGKQLFPDNRCIPGTGDPSCLENLNKPKPTTKRPTTYRPRCYPGSNDIRCPKTKPRCYIGSTDPSCTTTTPPPPTTVGCFPGSLDPDCQPSTKDGRYGSILFPATITTTPSTTTTELITTPFTVPTIPTTTPRRSGGILFPDTRTTKKTTKSRPVLKPKTTTTKSPKRGKQLNEPKSKPEPTGKEWEGESRYHAFHSFHFQRGDGRRSRRFGQRISSNRKRTIRSLTDPENPRPLVGKMPVKLSRAMIVVSSDDFDVPDVKELLVEVNQPSTFICLSSFSITSLAIFIALLIIIVAVILVLYVRQKRISK